MDVAGKKALVFGGTSGIGRATVVQLAEQGAEVVAISRNPDKAGRLPAGVPTQACDVLDRQAMADLFAANAPFDILVSAATGLNVTAADIEKVGERLNNVAKLFNIDEGFTRKDDSFPKRIMTEAIRAGASKGEMISQAALDEMLDEYYDVRGWDREGQPTAAKLKELGIQKR